MSYASIDGLENEAQEAHIQDSIKLQKLKQGQNNNDTGLCEDCGQKIPEARLARIPNANCCVSCQEEREGNGTRITYRNPYMP